MSSPEPVVSVWQQIGDMMLSTEALAAFIGAVVGGGFTLVGSYSATRHAHRLQVRQEDYRLAQEGVALLREMLAHMAVRDRPEYGTPEREAYEYEILAKFGRARGYLQTRNLLKMYSHVTDFIHSSPEHAGRHYNAISEMLIDIEREVQARKSD